ncbi:MAG: hypothetical protein ACXWRA_13240 [Pseudobdellovibrionaceae bacterium]
MRQNSKKWMCETIKKEINEMSEGEFKEKLERVWELLQSQERQPVKIFRPENPIDELVGDPVKHYRRSA